MATKYLQLFLPEVPEAYFDFRWVAPGGEEYTLQFSWNGRSGWYLGMIDQSEEELFAPRKLRPGANLLETIVSDGRPSGSLHVLALDEDYSKPVSFSDLGSRVVLLYTYEDGE